ncbi:YajG family lipoprotein [Marinobacterium arenosum]|uniref:YajG family lipoprotein n=1 Tax=Marinobacterium arenosum TaxID=2862496 RepID=UPI001C96E5C7|nr:YajG family lipoprotein [Marinobacterium arenosum]MBY4677976.1 YajG family lipoprotein [Marinobacterium arenosum]
MRKSLLAGATLALLLAGCSGLPSQNLSLHPEVEIKQPLPDKQVQLEVRDLRAHRTVGERIDKFKNRAPITLSGAETMLEHALEHALQSAGISNFGPGGPRLVLLLDELSYEATQKGVKQTVALAIKLRLNAGQSGEGYSGSYGSKLSEEFLRTPTPADNEELINKLLQQTLTRALNDPQLAEFLRSH